jgi:hypothetical protein
MGHGPDAFDRLLKKMEKSEIQGSMRTVVAASTIGTTIEWYDFLIYSTAASLILNKIFFPTQDPLVGKLLAIGTISVGFFRTATGGHHPEPFWRSVGAQVDAGPDAGQYGSWHDADRPAAYL